MKVLLICIAGLLLLCSVNAISDQEIADKDACIKSLPNPCQDSDTACKTELNKVTTCFKAVGQYPTFKELADKVKSTCKSDNSQVQKQIDGVVSCLSSSIIVFYFLAAILAFIF
ncbi:transmembrane protein, putative (macronuclear) [Tetrahymena thermophila SB210]|uniref:Transmembrane protein, putative n=1 Tax=Tetrahymena thermophila (strain SB210) TaxID=312017 RepID=Q23E50_TETTS|nr:transmembrane protein, putative [Tetrahymena thermophila SB210]EAR94737.1 transmembrane protein, putative [Tetrahymena thermophila SB210]|eukprot:XP_001014982.1 transmembrane protein, putative [Tetrahymena thermophila SB210]